MFDLIILPSSPLAGSMKKFNSGKLFNSSVIDIVVGESDVVVGDSVGSGSSKGSASLFSFAHSLKDWNDLVV